jgi:hypothetical protein
METYDSALVSLPESTSRHALDLWMIPPDSTPPVLVGAVAFDTITVVLEFDDPLEPEAPLDSVRISVVPEFGGAEIRVVDLRVGQPGPQADLPAGRAAPGGQSPDSLRDDEEPEIRTDTLNILEEVEAADSLPGAADSISAATDSIAVADSLTVGGRERGEPGQPGQPGRPGLASTEARERPFPFLIVTLEQALTEDTFRVAVTGVSNLRGLTGGGDTTFVYVAPLPALAPADSDEGPSAGPAAVEDSTGVLPGQRPPVSPRQKRDERR